METVYIIRHATPDWNRKDLVYHLPPGPPLTELGEVEAGALGAFLLNAGVTRLHASPLERTLRTAQIAAQVAGAQVQVDERLIEWQPEEAHAAIRSRMLAALETLQSHNGHGQPLGLVSHGGPIDVLLQALGMPESMVAAHRRFDHANPIPPAGAWQAWRASSAHPWELRLVFTPAGVERLI
jgi:probable phosphoglycerate mutase